MALILDKKFGNVSISFTSKGLKDLFESFPIIQDVGEYLLVQYSNGGKESSFNIKGISLRKLCDLISNMDDLVLELFTMLRIGNNFTKENWEINTGGILYKGKQ